MPTTHLATPVAQRAVRIVMGVALATATVLGAVALPATAQQAHRVAATTKVTLAPVSGYTYVAAPASFSSFLTSVKATGLISSAVLKGAKDKKDIQEVVLLAQYNAKMTKLTDKASQKTLLDGGVAGMKSSFGSKVKATDHVMVGTHVRELTVSGISIVLTYMKGGKLLEIFGPSSASTLNFAKLYLSSAKAHGQKLA